MAYTFTVARMSIIGYIVGTLVYRLYFSPLSKIPGSKLAAATLWYEFYYDVILGGQYTFKIKELHQKHGSNHVHWGHGMLSFNVRTDSSVGPIIRISPYEVHIDDPEYYHTLYSHRCPRDKCDYHVKPFNLPKSSFGTESARVHRLRRGAMNPFFSRGFVLKHESLVQDLVQKFCRRVEEFARDEEIVPLSLGFTCLTRRDHIICSEPVVSIFKKHPDWHPHWGQTLKDASKLSVITKQVAWTLPIPKCFPQSWAKALNPGLALFFDLTQRTHRRILEVLKEREQERGVSGPGRRKTLIDQLLDSKLPQEEKSMERLAAEIRSAIGAGTETTSNSMTYHLLANPQKLQRLRDELLKLGPGREANLCELEQLPYLSSCILEGLRCVSPARRGKHLRRRCAEITSPGYPTALVPASNANQTTQRSYTKHIEFLPGLLLG
ncbi:CND5p [Coccidioides immitis H538.4]|uniref:CND5p n=1 Tax=Coccidioides immitis H538.4 TaxID=396776 RepID=A0A0J8S683_COCIT|nr:CND5p [Coccidioides immitis H538.4]